MSRDILSEIAEAIRQRGLARMDLDYELKRATAGRIKAEDEAWRARRHAERWKALAKELHARTARSAAKEGSDE